MLSNAVENDQQALPLSPLPPIDHVGIAVQHTADALCLYAHLLGLSPGPTETLESEGVRITFLTSATTRLELLEPLSAESPVGRFIDKRGEGLHHLCVRVPDIVAACDTLRGAGYGIVDAIPRRGLHGELLVFVHPKTAHGVMVELYQVDSAAP